MTDTMLQFKLWTGITPSYRTARVSDAVTEICSLCPHHTDFVAGSCHGSKSITVNCLDQSNSTAQSTSAVALEYIGRVTCRRFAVILDRLLETGSWYGSN